MLFIVVFLILHLSAVVLITPGDLYVGSKTKITASYIGCVRNIESYKYGSKCSGMNMTIEKCIQICSIFNFKEAGTSEWCV
jgi:hypothetical protein